MPTSMLDALVDEQIRITALAFDVSKLAIEVLRRNILLQEQLQEMAASERNAMAARSEPKLITNAPEVPPASQDGEQGKQGSAALAPGDAKAGYCAKVEQAVADVAPAERVSARNDAGAAPDTYGERYDDTLTAYATSKFSIYALARRLRISGKQVEAHIFTGRQNGDRRVAVGDLARDIGVPLERREGKLQEAKPIESPVPRSAILDLNLKDCIATYDEQSIQLVRWELRLVLFLNSGLPVSLDDILGRGNFVNGRSFKQGLSTLNPRLREIGVTIAELVGDYFQLQAIESAQ